jgi:hypothetical protein
MKRLIFLLIVSIMSVCFSCKKEQTKEVMENTDNNKKLQTIVELNVVDYECENIYTNETYHAIFQLKNIGKNPLRLDRVSTSCGCFFAEWDRQAVNPGETSEIDVEMNWDKEGYFNQSIDVYCNIAVSPITLTVSGNVKDSTLIKKGGER